MILSDQDLKKHGFLLSRTFEDTFYYLKESLYEKFEITYFLNKISGAFENYITLQVCSNEVMILPHKSQRVLFYMMIVKEEKDLDFYLSNCWHYCSAFAEQS